MTTFYININKESFAASVAYREGQDIQLLVNQSQPDDEELIVLGKSNNPPSYTVSPFVHKPKGLYFYGDKKVAAWVKNDLPLLVQMMMLDGEYHKKFKSRALNSEYVKAAKGLDITTFHDTFNQMMKNLPSPSRSAALNNAKTDAIFYHLRELILAECIEFHQHELDLLTNFIERQDFPGAHQSMPREKYIDAVYGNMKWLSPTNMRFISAGPKSLDEMVPSHANIKQTIMSDGSYRRFKHPLTQSQGSFVTISYRSGDEKVFDVWLHRFNDQETVPGFSSTSCEHYGLAAATSMIQYHQKTLVLSDSDSSLARCAPMIEQRNGTVQKVKGHGSLSSANFFGLMNHCADELARELSAMSSHEVSKMSSSVLYLMVRKSLIKYFPLWKNVSFSAVLTNSDHVPL